MPPGRTRDLGAQALGALRALSARAPDRSAIEALPDDDYHFTSPIGNALDRATYLKVCWPNSAIMARFEPIHEVEDRDRAFNVASLRGSDPLKHVRIGQLPKASAIQTLTQTTSVPRGAPRL